MTANIIHHRQNPINLNEVGITIFVLRSQKSTLEVYLKILSRNLDFVKFLELKVTEPRTKLFQIHFLGSLIQHLLEMVSPFAKISNVRLQCQFLTVLRKHKVCFKSGLSLDGREYNVL
jgi:hypothetical protein